MNNLYTGNTRWVENTKPDDNDVTRRLTDIIQLKGFFVFFSNVFAYLLGVLLWLLFVCSVFVFIQKIQFLPKLFSKYDEKEFDKFQEKSFFIVFLFICLLPAEK